MRVSKAKAAENRERMLARAGRLFRAHGFAGVGVDALAQAAGLTHGGVYSQFGSKQALAAASVAQAFAETAARWEQVAREARVIARSPIDAIAEGYLSAAHRDRPDQGCILAALGAEGVRADPAVREAFAQGTKTLIGVLAQYAAGDTEDERRRSATRALAAMLGGLLLARLMQDTEALAAGYAAAISPADGS